MAGKQGQSTKTKVGDDDGAHEKDFEPTAEEQAFEKHLRSQYYLLARKGVIGTAIGALIAAGIISYGAAKTALATSTQYATEQQMKELLASAKADSTTIGELRKQAQNEFPLGILVQHVKASKKADDRNIQAPPGTTRDDWDVFVIPDELGIDEPGSESDNALIKVEARAEPIPGTSDSWHIIAMYRYREANSVTNAPPYYPAAQVVLVRRVGENKAAGAQQ
jgi:hypothetical protein